MAKILVIAAHPDDEILGVGATAAKLIKSGHEVNALVLGEGISSRYAKKTPKVKTEIKELQNITRKACKIIGYKGVYFEGLPDNNFDSKNLLEVTKLIEKHVGKYKPEIIYTHHKGDLNIDHEITFRAVITACRPVSDYSVKEINCFETLSSTEWNFGDRDNIFNPNVFVDIEKTIDLKLKALRLYKGETREFPHPRSLEAIKINASRWGSVVGKKFVEAFELIRKVE